MSQRARPHLRLRAGANPHVPDVAGAEARIDGSGIAALPVLSRQLRAGCGVTIEFLAPHASTASPAAADRRYTMYAMFEAWVG